MTKRELGPLIDGLEQIVVMLNLYTSFNEEACRKYLNSKRKNRDKLLEDCTDTSAFISTTISNLTLLSPFLLANDISIGIDAESEKYVLLYKGKEVIIEYAESDYSDCLDALKEEKKEENCEEKSSENDIK